MPTGHWDGLARYGLPGLVAGLALAWWGGGHGPTARAQGAAPGAETNGIISFATPINNSSTSAQLFYVVDTRSQAFAVYRVDPTNPRNLGVVKLEAARQFGYDLKLSEYNNQPPEVSSVEAMVKTKPK